MITTSITQTDPVWDKAGIEALRAIKQDIEAEQADSPTWNQLATDEKLARLSMVKTIDEIIKEAAQ